jgi:hypothetical protein
LASKIFYLNATKRSEVAPSLRWLYNSERQEALMVPRFAQDLVLPLGCN